MSKPWRYRSPSDITLEEHYEAQLAAKDGRILELEEAFALSQQHRRQHKPEPPQEATSKPPHPLPWMDCQNLGQQDWRVRDAIQQYVVKGLTSKQSEVIVAAANALGEQYEARVAELENEMGALPEDFSVGEVCAIWQVDKARAEAAEARVAELEAQFGFTYCTYCGDKFPVNDEAVAKVTAHIETCPNHPIANIKARAEAAEGRVAELEQVIEKLDWQNQPNRNPAARGGFEFYINECWDDLARRAIDVDAGFAASLRKNRIDPDEDRVRVRLVRDDDRLISDLAQTETRVAALEAALERWSSWAKTAWPNDFGSMQIERDTQTLLDK